MDITEIETVCSDPACAKPTEGYVSLGGLCRDCSEVRRYEEASRVWIAEYRVVKVSRRTDAVTVLLDWASDPDHRPARPDSFDRALAAAQKVRLETEAALKSTAWDVRMERRQVDHPLYAEVRAAELYVRSATGSFRREAERIVRLMESAGRDVRRAAERAEDDDRLAGEVYRAVMKVVGNAQIDSVYAYEREVAVARTTLAGLRAALEALEAGR